MCYAGGECIYFTINEQIRNIAQKRERLGLCPKPHQEPEVLGFPTFKLKNLLKPKRSVEGSLRDEIPQAGLGLESRARCAGFSAMEIGNHKKRLRFYMSFPGRQPNVSFSNEATF